MSDLTFSPQEQALLQEVVARFVADLRTEIADTDNFDYRTGLKEKRDALTALGERLAIH